VLLHESTELSTAAAALLLLIQQLPRHMMPMHSCQPIYCSSLQASMAQQCRVVINKLEGLLTALLAEKPSDSSITLGLKHKFDDVEAAVTSCRRTGPWGYNTVKHLVQDKVSTELTCKCVVCYYYYY
jgi:hypothetical protein